MISSVGRRLLLIAPTAVLAAAGLLVAAPGAQASLLSLSTCNTNAVSQPFAPWLDFSSYELAPGGTFADRSWSLSGGASYVSGGEPWGVSGSVSSSSLSLPAGSSAQSPVTCDTAAYPTVRYFVGGTGILAVSVVDGGLAIPAGTTTALGGWAPSLPGVTLSAVTGLLSGGTTQIALRFTSVAGNPKVSDVYVDPWSRW